MRNRGIVPPGSLKRYPLTDQIVEWLAEQIVTGQLGPGAPLPEQEISETLGCSRSPLREAFRILAYEGLVELNPGRVATVAPLEARTVEDFFDTRDLLETQATWLATIAMTDADLAELLDMWQRVKDAAEGDDYTQYLSLNWQMHALLYGFCGNETLLEVIGVMWRRTLRYGQLLSGDPQRVNAAMSAKERLIELIAERDSSGAAACMSRIIVARKAEVVRALTEGADDPYGFWARQAAAQP